MAYSILSFDGGGVRGVYTAILLERLTTAVPTLISGAKLLAGTSTGGIIALGLAAGKQPRELVALYRDNASRIFDDSWLRDLANLNGLSGSDYDNKSLKQILQQILDRTRLKDLNHKVLISSFQLDNQDHHPSQRRWKPKFFHNYAGPESDGEELAVDVALRTSAAPVYFPSYQIYIDGGVVANDPSMAALAQAVDPATGAQHLEDLRIFSIGTGANPTYIEGSELDWGVAQWARPLINLMIDGVMGVAQYQCSRLLGAERYFRLEPYLPKAFAMDDARTVGELAELAERVDLAPAIDWLKRNMPAS